MEYLIKEARLEYKLTQKDMSEITQIPLRTIENWETGKRKPSPWVEKLVIDYLHQYPVNDNGIVTEKFGVYTLEQIKKQIFVLSYNYPFQKVVLFGSYAKGKAKPSSDIDFVVDGVFEGLSFFALLEDMTNSFVKNVDLFHLSQFTEGSPMIDEMMKGIIVYER